MVTVKLEISFESDPSAVGVRNQQNQCTVVIYPTKVWKNFGNCIRNRIIKTYFFETRILWKLQRNDLSIVASRICVRFLSFSPQIFAVEIWFANP